MKLQRLYSFLKTDIDIIEKELIAAIQSESKLLETASLNLIGLAEKEYDQFLYFSPLNLEIMILRE